MSTTHPVERGETFVGIAFKEGFRSWEKIWNHPENEALRTARSSPDDIHVGDIIFIPDKEAKTVSIEAFAPDSDAAQTYTFVVKAPKLHLSFRLEDDAGDAYADKRYQMTVNTPQKSIEIEGRTDNDGMVIAAIAPNAQSLDLTLWPETEGEPETVIWNFQLGAMEAPESS